MTWLVPVVTELPIFLPRKAQMGVAGSPWGFDCLPDGWLPLGFEKDERKRTEDPAPPCESETDMSNENPPLDTII